MKRCFHRGLAQVVALRWIQFSYRICVASMQKSPPLAAVNSANLLRSPQGPAVDARVTRLLFYLRDLIFVRAAPTWSLLVAFLSFICIRPVMGDTVVLPKGYDHVEGGGAYQPFTGVERTQLIFGAENFSEVMPEGALITGIAFRLDGRQGDSVNATLQNFEVRVSTTPSLRVTAPFPWESTSGTDQITVFRRGAWRVKAENLPGQGPNPFSLALTFERPFPYNPKNGNLLVDLIAYEPGQLGRVLVDAGESSSTEAYHGGVSLALTSIPIFVSQLTFTPVPEPGPLVMLLLGLVLFRVRGSIYTK